jgi:hypothetical protein
MKYLKQVDFEKESNISITVLEVQEDDTDISSALVKSLFAVLYHCREQC